MRKREWERELKVEDDIKSCGRDRIKWEKAAGRGAAALSVLRKRGVPKRGRVGQGYGRRGTLTLAGSPPPFPYIAAPASPGPAPASVWRAVDTRPSSRLAPCTTGFSLHYLPKALSHDCAGMPGYDYTRAQKASLWCRRRSIKSVQPARNVLMCASIRRDLVQGLNTWMLSCLGHWEILLPHMTLPWAEMNPKESKRLSEISPSIIYRDMTEESNNHSIQSVAAAISHMKGAFLANAESEVGQTGGEASARMGHSWRHLSPSTCLMVLWAQE